MAVILCYKLFCLAQRDRPDLQPRLRHFFLFFHAFIFSLHPRGPPKGSSAPLHTGRYSACSPGKRFSNKQACSFPAILTAGHFWPYLPTGRNIRPPSAFLPSAVCNIVVKIYFPLPRSSIFILLIQPFLMPHTPCL